MSKKLEFKMSSENYEDDADEGSSITKEEERERKKAVQARIRKEQAEGPPPDMSKRSVSYFADCSKRRITLCDVLTTARSSFLYLS